jgi:hypothetical protein
MCHWVKTLAIGGISEDVAGAVRFLGRGYDKITIKSNRQKVALPPPVKGSIFDIPEFLI